MINLIYQINMIQATIIEFILIIIIIVQNMVRNYFKTAWRSLINNKAHSFINIAGLSVGLACSLLIFLWVQNELSVDAFYKNNDKLYKVYEREYYKDHIDGDYDTPGLLAEELKKKIPEVEDARSEGRREGKGCRSRWAP